jgi:hypothetical protein
VIRVKIVTQKRSRDFGRDEEWHVAELINVLWHPIDGESVAVLQPWGEINVYPLSDVTPTEADLHAGHKQAKDDDEGMWM